MTVRAGITSRSPSWATVAGRPCRSQYASTVSVPARACIPEHRVGLPDSGGNPEVGAQRAPDGLGVRLAGTSPGDRVRAVLAAGPCAAGHGWIHSGGWSGRGPQTIGASAGAATT